MSCSLKKKKKTKIASALIFVCAPEDEKKYPERGSSKQIHCK